jgi:hypothetical protein
MATISQVIKRKNRRKSREEWYKIPEEERLALIREKIKEKHKSPEEIENYVSHKVSQKSYYERNKNFLKFVRIETRKKFIDMYGGVCVCCGESVFEFLTIDHIKGQKGRPANRREGGYKCYKKAVAEYRPDLYRVLCMNCNHVIGRYGYCPHQESNLNLMLEIGFGL